VADFNFVSVELSHSITSVICVRDKKCVYSIFNTVWEEDQVVVSLRFCERCYEFP
jgi:hypothetical protein